MGAKKKKARINTRSREMNTRVYRENRISGRLDPRQIRISPAAKKGIEDYLYHNGNLERQVFKEIVAFLEDPNYQDQHVFNIPSAPTVLESSIRLFKLTMSEMEWLKNFNYTGKELAMHILPWIDAYQDGDSDEDDEDNAVPHNRQDAVVPLSCNLNMSRGQ